MALFWTSIIGVIIGGVLTFISGLIATYYTHRQTASDEKRKEMLEVIGRVYKLALDVNDKCVEALEHAVTDTEKRKLLNSVVENRQTLIMLVALYAPDLAKEASSRVPKKQCEMLSDYVDGKITEEEFGKSFDRFHEDNEHFRWILAKYLREKHYIDVDL